MKNDFDLKAGLVSVTFRDKSPEEIVAMTAEVGLDAIEWGGDIHVPHEDVEKAREVRSLCESRGIATPSYGSYYRAGVSERADGPLFSDVLATARELRVEMIRIWGGKASADLSDSERRLIVDDILRTAELASEHGIAVGLEFHSNTLTDTDESVSRLLDELDDAGNVYLYWQPRVGATTEEALKSLRLVEPRLGNIHVFHWNVLEDGKLDHRPFAEGKEVWTRYFAEIAGFEAKPRIQRHAMLEFVRNGDPANLAPDAAVLRSLLVAESNG